MKLNRNVINQIVSNVFDEMLDLTTEFCDSDSSAFQTERVVASVRISGELDGVVVVDAPLSTAQRIGETMFSADACDLEDVEICDAVGEIVNMIGGNIKGLSAGDSQLSIPCCSRKTDKVVVEFPLNQEITVTVSGLPLKVGWYQLCTDGAVT